MRSTTKIFAGIVVLYCAAGSFEARATECSEMKAEAAEAAIKQVVKDSKSFHGKGVDEYIFDTSSLVYEPPADVWSVVFYGKANGKRVTRYIGILDCESGVEFSVDQDFRADD